MVLYIMVGSPAPSMDVLRFLNECGLQNFEVSLLNKGGNNKAYKVISTQGIHVLKAYFTSKQDQRNRLKNEFTFSQFCWDNHVHCISQPFFANYDKHLGLYGYINGEKLRPEEIKEVHIDQCINFIKKINNYKTSDQAKNLPIGSEACFSLKEHLETVERRIKRLETVDEALPVDKEAKKFVLKFLFPIWQEIKQSFYKNCQMLEFNFTMSISQRDKILSPSDFGFHNALHAINSSQIALGLKFIDFEYAGWDDPAKLVCDFFNQVAVPVPDEFYSYFSQEITNLIDNPTYHQRRIDLLMPIYAIKWISIMLNDFLPQNRFRQDFLEFSDINNHKASQLSKAENGLRKLTVTCF